MKIYQCFALISIFIFAYFVQCDIGFSKITNNFSRVGFGGKRKECIHSNVTWGTRVNGDKVAYDHIVKDKRLCYSRRVVETKYPPPPQVQGPCNITMINVENLYRGCDCFNEVVNVTAGGIGKRNMTVRMTSQAKCPNHHRITCFVKC